MILKYYEIEKELKKGSVSPVYLFTGKEMGIAEDLIDQIKALTVSPAVEAFNVSKFDSKDADLTEILASAETLPVMSEYRMIIIGDQTDLFNIKDEKLSERFLTYFKNPSPSTVLIILSEKPDKRRKFYKSLSKSAKVVDFSKLNYQELSRWVQARLKKDKISITPKALDLFIERTHYLDNDSVDILTIDNYLKQLKDYSGKEGISEEIVRDVIPESVEDNVFKMVDMAVSGKLKGIPEILEYFWEHNESPIRLFGLVLYQLRNLTQINLLLRQGVAQNAMASKTGLAPFVIRKTVPMARRFQSRRLLNLFREAADLDFKIKTGQIDPAFALEYLLLKLNQKK